MQERIGRKGGAGTWRYKSRWYGRARGIIHGDKVAPQVRDSHQGRGLDRREGLDRVDSNTQHRPIYELVQEEADT